MDTALDEGFQAFSDGKGQGSCPYPDQSNEYADWMNGWAIGQMAEDEAYSRDWE